MRCVILAAHSQKRDHRHATRRRRGRVSFSRRALPLNHEPPPPMPHGTTLIATIALAFAVALLFGIIAARLSLPPIVGYLLAGIAIGVASPTLAANGGVASQASEL